MANAQKDQIAQAVYLAQLQAAKGTCNCPACQLLRKATDAMTQEMLAPPAAVTVLPGGGVPDMSQIINQISNQEV